MIKTWTRAALLKLTNPELIAPKLRARQYLSKSTDIRRIVIVRPDHLGDLLFATPALERIREAFPGAHITGMVGPWGRAMWEGNPNLDALEVVRFPGIAGNEEGGALGPYRLLNRVGKALAKRRYDLGVVLRFDHWWGAAMLAAAGVPRRWGYDTPGMGVWLTDAVPHIGGRHEVEQDLALVEAVIEGVDRARARYIVPLQVDRDKGTPPLRPPHSTPLQGDLLADWLASPVRVVIHPGTAAANKLWTIEGWAEVASRLLDEGWAVAITGAPNEKMLADAIVEATRARYIVPLQGLDVGTQRAVPLQRLVNLAGQTTNLSQLAWALDQAHIVLGVDSGPLHIADALGKPTLHLYGPSDEAIWGPWGDAQKHRALRAPGTRPTMRLDTGSAELEGGPEMRAITVEMVMAEVQELKGYL